MRTIALAAFALATLAGSAAAEVLPPTARGPAQAYRETKVSDCPLESACWVKFTKVPESHQLRIDRLSCRVGGIGWVTLYVNKFSEEYQKMMDLLPTGDGVHVSSPGPYFFTEGEAPFIYANSGFVLCSLTGYLMLNEQ